MHIVRLIDMVYPNNKYRYDCAVNIEDLVKLSDVMIEHSLGPNGGKSIPSLLFEVFVYLNFWLVLMSQPIASILLIDSVYVGVHHQHM
jgi:hypothetical protein